MNFNSRLEELDFNSLNLRLDARNGGLDSTVVIGPEGNAPGFVLGIRSQATVTAQLGFTDIQLSAEIRFWCYRLSGFNLPLGTWLRAAVSMGYGLPG